MKFGPGPTESKSLTLIQNYLKVFIYAYFKKEYLNIKSKGKILKVQVCLLLLFRPEKLQWMLLFYAYWNLPSGNHLKTLQMRVRGVWETRKHFKRIRISFGINLREQGIFVLLKGMMEFINREQGGKVRFYVSKEHTPTPSSLSPRRPGGPETSGVQSWSIHMIQASNIWTSQSGFSKRERLICPDFACMLTRKTFKSNHFSLKIR